MEAIKSGVLTKSARVEIVHAMHDRMMQHTYYPTPEEYRIACWRLIEKYKSLQDKIGTGIVSFIFTSLNHVCAEL